jgi:hypothetical protein
MSCWDGSYSVQLTSPILPELVVRQDRKVCDFFINVFSVDNNALGQNHWKHFVHVLSAACGRRMYELISTSRLNLPVAVICAQATFGVNSGTNLC